MNTKNCNENFLGMAAEILAVPEENVDFYLPVDCADEVLDASYFVADYQHGFMLMAKKKTIRISESLSASLAGDAYEAKVSWDVDAPDIATARLAEAQFKRLKRGANHLFISMVDGQRYVLRVHKGAYSFNYIEKDGHYECQFKAHSVSGFQRIPIR